MLNYQFFREANWSDESGLEKTEGARPKEDPLRLGRELRRMPREGRLHSLHRETEA